MLDTVLTIRLNRAERERLRALARATERNASQVIRLLIRTADPRRLGAAGPLDDEEADDAAAAGRGR